MVRPPPFLDRRRAIPLLYADLEKRGGPSSEPRPGESSRRTFGEAASGGRRAGEAALRRAPHHRWGTRTGGADISWAAAITNGPGSRKEPLHGQVPRRPGSQNAGFPEGGRMTWHSFLERDTSAGGRPYPMEWPRIPRSGPRDLAFLPRTPKGPMGCRYPTPELSGTGGF